MTALNLYSEISSLPSDLQQEVADFVDFLKSKTKIKKKEKIKLRGEGLPKIRVTMSPDFDAPLDEFKEYM